VAIPLTVRVSACRSSVFRWMRTCMWSGESEWECGYGAGTVIGLGKLPVRKSME
jgi:hypothetical protein